MWTKGASISLPTIDQDPELLSDMVAMSLGYGRSFTTVDWELELLGDLVAML